MVVPRRQVMVPRPQARVRRPPAESTVDKVRRIGRGRAQYSSFFGLAASGGTQIAAAFTPAFPFVIEAVALGMDIEQSGLGVLVQVAIGSANAVPATAFEQARDVLSYFPGKEIIRYPIEYLYDLQGGQVTMRVLNATAVTVHVPVTFEWRFVEARESLADPMGSTLPRGDRLG